MRFLSLQLLLFSLLEVCSGSDLLFLLEKTSSINILCSLDAISTPQIGAQFGEIHNNGTGGGNLTPYQGGNSSASVPGSGYPLVFVY